MIREALTCVNNILDIAYDKKSSQNVKRQSDNESLPDIMGYAKESKASVNKKLPPMPLPPPIIKTYTEENNIDEYLCSCMKYTCTWQIV